MIAFFGYNPRHRGLIRDIEAGDFLETLLVSAVASILTLRAYLFLTGYPTVGSGQFHIAHLLWGGFAMFIALVLLLGYVNRSAKRAAAVIGGIGFGMFIDELGKFITKDNNYFFQPAIAIIYVLFIALYLVFRSIARSQVDSHQGAELNAVELLKEAVDHDLDHHEKERAMRLLEVADQSDPIVQSLRELFTRLDSITPPRPGLLGRIRCSVETLYARVVDRLWFPRAVVAFFAIQSGATLITLAVQLLSPSIRAQAFSLSFSGWGQLICSTTSALLVVVGIVHIRHNRPIAFQWFKRGVLVSIFLTRFFVFYDEQTSAVLGLGFDLLLLIVIRSLISLDSSIGAQVGSQTETGPN